MLACSSISNAINRNCCYAIKTDDYTVHSPDSSKSLTTNCFVCCFLTWWYGEDRGVGKRLAFRYGSCNLMLSWNWKKE